MRDSTQTLVRMFDASLLPGKPYPGCQAMAAYIGGNTPHVSTAPQWNAASDGGRLYQLPIWVGFGEADPVQHAQDAARAAISLGWVPHHAPAWRAIVADVEAVSEQAWLSAFGAELRRQGFLCWPYMSAVALPSDPPGYTVWLAEWNGVDNVPAIHDVIGHQYAPDVPYLGTAVDLSAFLPSALGSFGIGPRR
jgi:hypothetical protein